MVVEMREMKDSGISWIGEIPKDWNVCPFPIYFESIVDYRGKTPEKVDDGVFLVTARNIKDGKMNYDVSQEYVRHEDYDGIMHRGLPHIGDVLFTTEAPLGEVANVDRTDIALAQRVIKFSGKVGILDNYYLKYWIYNPAFQDDLKSFGTGSTAQGIKASKLNKLRMVLPPYFEQKIIVAFLDSKCVEIAALSASIQSEIETLEAYKWSVITEAVTKGLDKDVPMKESGMPWIGNMPAHWGLIRGKYCLKYLQKPVKEDDGVITCFRDGEVTLRSNRREEGFTMSDKEIGYQGIDAGDLVVHGMDGFAGAIGISDSRGKASPVLNVLDTQENKKYFMYYLRSMAYGDVFLALATGIRVRSCDLRWNKLAELFYPIPPQKEQEQIVAFIDEQLKQANNIIAQKQEQLSVLADYKKSIIYEYVTGKKEVPVA